MDKNVKRKMQIVLGVTMILTLILFVFEIRGSRTSEIKRNTYGEGSKKEQYEVTVGNRLSGEPVEIEVHERRYSKEEIRKVFKQTMDKLEQTILGENKSVDHVEHDLNLITEMPDVPLEITWESNRNEIINNLGEIQEENLTAQGELVELKGYLSYGDEECLYIVNVMVYPRTLSGKEKLLNQLQALIVSADENSLEDPVVSLPGEIDGEDIVWKKESEHKSMYIAVLGVIIVLLIYVQDKQKKETSRKLREDQLQADYPEIVNQISLLVGAGLNVKNAWNRIVSNYQENKAAKGSCRYAYEEMIYTVREMQGGIPEAESYEHFGKRCGMSQYMKLGTLLSQNTRKGTKGLVKLLDEEAGQALEEKKQRAKKRGEETSTKLLLPMSLMLIVVLVIIIVPAFLSISL